MKNLDFQTTLALGLVLAGTLASAQDRISAITGSPAPGDSKIEAGLAFSQSLGSTTFGATQTIKDYAEDGTLRSSYKVGTAPGGAFDLQYNLGRTFGVRAGFQVFSRKSTGTFEAQVPHPFFFSRLRNVSGAQTDMGFSQSAISLTAVYRTGSGKWRINVEGGPAYFNVNATIADRITLGETYPYDTVKFGGVSSSKKKVSPIGFVVGVEIGREISKSVALVAHGRFSQGTGDVDVSGQKISIKAGGGQAGIGLRLTLARAKASS
ncbi:MAG: hypothetical protein K1Y01_21505 [Vicinamibacteria bacterium]|nr:hypothetical protein [Vicinamibacteria bacterium]